MKIWFITDTHHGIHRSTNLNTKWNKYKSGDYWLENINNFYYSFLIPLLKKEFNPEEDYLFHLGDVYHVNNEEWINIKDLDFTAKLYKNFIDFIKNPIYILVGNHDTIQSKSLEINALNILSNEKIKIIKEPEKIKLGNKEILLLPYYREVLKQRKILKDNKADWLFCHSDINGAITNKNSDERLKSGLIKEDYDNYSKILSGHIHINQYLYQKRWLYLGSPYQMDLNDKGDNKGIWSLDLETDEMSFYENNINPVFMDIILDKEDDINKLNIKIGNYYNLVIRRSLLVKDGKIKEEIQNLINEIQPYNIKWINDIKNKKIEQTLEVKAKLSYVNDDMYSVIKELAKPLLKEKEYSEKVFDEIDNIINIHKSIN